MELTKIGVEENTNIWARHPKRSEKTPYFRCGKLEDPWQIEDNTTTTQKVPVDKKRCG